MKHIYLLIFALILFTLPTISFAQESISLFNTDIVVNTDATISVNEKISYNFPSAKHGIYRYIPFIYNDSENKEFRLNFTNIDIKYENGSDVPFERSTSGDNIYLKIGDANKTITGPQTYDIKYSVKGAINYFDDYDELYWNVTGNDWEIPIRETTAIVTLPDKVDENAIRAKCFTGLYGSTAENCTKKINGKTIQFSTNSGYLTVVIGWNKAVVDITEKDYTFLANLSPLTWFFILAIPFIIPLVVLIYMIKKVRREGGLHDKGATVTPEFAPPNYIGPAEMGTIIDSKVDPGDLTSEIINFAVKGVIKIKELKKGFFGSQNYELIVDRGLPVTAKKYEKDLFEEIFRGKKTIKLSDLKKRTDAYSNFKAINDELYKSMKTRGYFIDNPQKTRNKYLIAGIITIVLGGVSFVYITLGLSLVISGLIIIISGRYMPKRTEKGKATMRQVIGFKEFISKAEKYRAKWAEKENLFFDFLPYAVLFGVSHKWANTFKDIAIEKPGWYEGNWRTFNTVMFINSVSNFNSSWQTSSRGSAAAGGASGFSSGGGFSGGGFGGGGGGSW